MAQINQHLQTNWKNSATANLPANLVPYPVQYESGSGSYIIANDVVIHNTLSADNFVASDYPRFKYVVIQMVSL